MADIAKPNLHAGKAIITAQGQRIVELQDICADLRAALAKSEEARETAERERANIWRWNREVFADLTTAQAVSATFEASLSQALARIEELEKARGDEHLVTISEMGWNDDGRFAATAIFTEPPRWPVAVVWNGLPVRIYLPATPIDGGTHG